MNFLKRIQPEWALRVGFGIMYLYSGFDLLEHPTAWQWALPYWMRTTITSILPLGTYLKLQGLGEIVMALGLLAWFLRPQIVQWFALFSTLEMAGILFFAFTPWSPTNFLITFRDIGLLGGAFALFIILKNKNETGYG